MTMGSRRSSDADTSGDDDGRSRDSISLEFDDYPLDLISPIRLEYDDRDLLSLGDWRLPDRAGDAADQKDPFLAGEIFKFVNEPDRLITDEIITDLGNRRSADYGTPEVTQPNGDIFVTAANLQQLSSVYPVECDEGADEEHYERKGRCSAVGRWFRLTCGTCLARNHPLPENAAWWERWRHSLLCPPHGWLAHSVSLVLLTFMAWALLWTIDGDDAQVGGGLLALVILTIASYVTGTVAAWIKLPALLGMSVAGCVLSNVPSINIIADIDPHLADIIRQTGLALLLVRSGLVLTPVSVRHHCSTALRLAVVVNSLDMATTTVLSKFMLGIPWLWSLLIGFLVAAAGPTVVNPCVLSLQSRGYGLNKAIPALLVAASSIDSIIPIAGFTVLLAVLGREGQLVLNIFRGPLEAVGGVLTAVVLGSVLWYIPHPLHSSRTLLRVLLVLCCSCLFSLGSWAVGLSNVMPIATVTLVFVVIPRWRRERIPGEKVKRSAVEFVFKKLWCIAQPLFYGILGTQVNISAISVKIIGVCFALIVISCVIRPLVTFLCLFRTSLNLKERIFVAFAWLPKISVQQTLACLAVNVLNKDSLPEEFGELNKMVLTMATLTSLITLPLGGILTVLTGPCLLSHTAHLLSMDTSEKMNFTWDNHNAFKPEMARLKVSDISTHTTEIEITTERETVT